MSLTGLVLQWLPRIVERLLDTVDDDLLDKVIDQGIERMQTLIEQSENNLDDRIILPLLEVIKLARMEKREIPRV